MSKFTKLLTNPRRFVIDSRSPWLAPARRMVSGPSRRPARTKRAARPRTQSAQPRTSSGRFIHLANVPVKAEVVVYFYGGIDRFYQLQAWLGPLRVLNERLPVAFVVRDLEVWALLQSKVRMPVVFCHTLKQLMSFYEHHDFKCALYVNHGVKNFQSLIASDMLHVHINHGESDKSCMHSNQAKAYDYVLVSSQAALDRYRRHLLGLTTGKFLQIGRPQLDFCEAEVRRVSEATTTVLYAPTWGATHESMDYSSVHRLGLDIARTFIDREGYYFIYRPHPSTGANNAKEKSANTAIIDLVRAASNAELHNASQIGGLFDAVDIAIFDNSSVAVDYLRADKPLLMTRVGAGAVGSPPGWRRFSALAGMPKADGTRSTERAPEATRPAGISTAAVTLDESNIGELAELVRRELAHDTLRVARNTLMQYYLGDTRPGESTRRFVETVVRLAALRDQLRAERHALSAEPPGYVLADGDNLPGEQLANQGCPEQEPPRSASSISDPSTPRGTHG